ncbi:MAG: murein hydrolase activator EnvC family protein [Sphingobacteriia bacterium]
MSIKRSTPAKPILTLALLAVLGLVGSYYRLYAQQAGSSQINNLKSREELLRRQVKQTELLLRQTQGIKRKSFNELVLLKEQINLRERLVKVINDEIDGISRDIDQIDGIIGSLVADVATFQKSYGQAARLAYLGEDDMSMMLWLMSSESFAQAYDRLVYFREAAKYRKQQIELIRRTSAYLARKKGEKEAKLARQKKLRGDRQEETGKLSRAKEEKDQLYNQLRCKQKNYEDRIQEYKRELALIRARIRKMVEANATVANKDVVNQLNGVFEKNRHKLPWPIPMNQGVVTGYFGRSRTATGGEVINDGIYISTRQGQAVRTVFDGKVTLVSRIPNYGQVVIVQHGSYRSVYANLEQVSVKVGDQLAVLQEIGTVRANSDTGEIQLYFQIYKGFNPVNPISWLAQK